MSKVYIAILVIFFIFLSIFFYFCHGILPGDIFYFIILMIMETPSLTPIWSSKSSGIQDHLSSYQRDLRFILTQKCNYQCSFCHKEWCDGSEPERLTPEDYTFLFSCAKDTIHTHQVTLTWWEPILRKDRLDIAKNLKNAWAYITMVSNGSLLDPEDSTFSYIDVLNISLHTTNQELFATLTWTTYTIDDIIDTLIAVHHRYPHLQIKLNSAIIKDQNIPGTDDFDNKMHLADKYWRKIKYLELSDSQSHDFFSLHDFEKLLMIQWFTPSWKTSRQHIFKKNNVQIITGKVFCSEAKTTHDPIAHCARYNDLYVTPDGYISRCPIYLKQHTIYDLLVSKNKKDLSIYLKKLISSSSSCLFT